MSDNKNELPYRSTMNLGRVAEDLGKPWEQKAGHVGHIWGSVYRTAPGEGQFKDSITLYGEFEWGRDYNQPVGLTDQFSMPKRLADKLGILAGKLPIDFHGQIYREPSKKSVTGYGWAIRIPLTK